MELGKGAPGSWNSLSKSLGVGTCGEYRRGVIGFGWSTRQVGKQQWIGGGCWKPSEGELLAGKEEAILAI